MPLPVRSLPPWVQDALADDKILDPDTPPQQTHQPYRSRWYSFGPGGAYPNEYPHSQRMPLEDVERLVPMGQTPIDYHYHYKEAGGEGSPERRRNKRSMIKRGRFILLRNPFVPLVFRLITITFAAAALALGASIHHEVDRVSSLSNGASSTIAVVVDAIAIPYIIWVTWDEYTGKPLGLRDVAAKLRITLLDLFFIVFEAANLALAFQSLESSNEGCDHGEVGAFLASVCNREEALTGVLLVATVTWLLTFTISLFRLVERVPKE